MYILLIFLSLNTYAYSKSKVLFLGDSHSVQTFGQTLDALMQEQNQLDVQTLAACGSRPETWLNPAPTNCGFFAHVHGFIKKVPYLTSHYTPDFELTLKAFWPNTTIVALGANQVGMPFDKAKANIVRMMQLIQSIQSQCIWIGPPLGKIPNEHPQKFEGIITSIKSAAKEYNCHYIDSTQHTYLSNYSGDGVHFDQMGEEGKELARHWAQAVWTQMKLLILK